MEESKEQRSDRILVELRSKYPGAEAFDMTGDGLHFACVVDPADQHPEYDRAVEVMIKSKPHYHVKMVQIYTILCGTLKLHVGEDTIVMNEGDKYTVPAGLVHWAESDNECWDELYSTPGWTPEDHIRVDEKTVPGYLS